MASNLTKRLDRLERLLAAENSASTLPLFVRAGDPIPEGREAIIVKREIIDPPERAAFVLPSSKAEPQEQAPPRNFRQRIAFPNVGVV